MNMFITHLIFYLNNTVLYESKIRTPKKEYEFFKLYMNYTIKLSHCQLLYFIFQYFLTAKTLGINKYGMDKNKSFGTGTLNAVNYFLDKWGYQQNGIVGENFIKRMHTEIENKVK